MRPYSILDVFTNRPLSGNPLAVVMDSADLNTKDMQSIAAEFNLSETVFVRPPERNSHKAELRIFTPKRELPFAGHPTIGTAILLAALDDLGVGEGVSFDVQEKLGVIPCEVTRDKAGFRASFILPVTPTYEPVTLDTGLLCDALGLEAQDIALSGHGPSVSNGGVRYPIVPISGLKAMANIGINAQALGECMAKIGRLAEVYVYTNECVWPDSHYHVRMFSPAFGITEDPATGSAAASMAAHILAMEKCEDGLHQFVLEQGLEMGRPSRIELEMTVKDAKLAQIKISGQAVIVANGQFHI